MFRQIGISRTGKKRKNVPPIFRIPLLLRDDDPLLDAGARPTLKQSGPQIRLEKEQNNRKKCSTKRVE